jgi:hypothetical protein
MSSPLEEQALATELYAIAQTAAARHGRTFKPIAEAELLRLTQAAAAETLSPSRFGSVSTAKASLGVDGRRQEAREAVVKLVQSMVTEAATIPGYSADLLGEQTLGRAFSRFCPCWPFC